MTEHLHFTEEQIEQASKVDLEALLVSMGERLLPSGRDKRLASDHSITIRGSEWYDHAISRGGNSISFMEYHFGLPFQDAMRYLLGMGDVYPISAKVEVEKPKPFILPKPALDMRRVFAYLIKERCIAYDVVCHFANKGLLYEDAKYHNAVFVGVDFDGVPKHAQRRSTNERKAYRLNVSGSQPQYSFHHVGTSADLYVFEAPIDMMSYISLYPEQWERDSYVACCGTSPKAVVFMLQKVPQIRKVYLCLDNDAVGRAAAKQMALILPEYGVETEELFPERKDWNDELVAARTKD